MMPRTEPLKLSREGRVLIPAKIRRQLQLEAGTELLGRVEDGRLILETRANALRRLRDRFSHLPEDLSLSAELIRDRRQEVERQRQLEEEGEPVGPKTTR
ncbi:MAG: AbrB/MazE/SpoVT family DNA-binding domain-containing protein [Holophagales bacterium]|nr:AbrB/MazE/SpoVT family DNA-binding domain-containing protein [Holophagales bacterium]